MTGHGHHEQGGVAGVHEDPQRPPARVLPSTFGLQLQGRVSDMLQYKHISCASGNADDYIVSHITLGSTLGKLLV